MLGTKARTLKAHDAAHDHNVPRTPLLHVGHHFFDHADHTKEVGLKHLLHLLNADAFNRSQQAHACIIDCQETNLLSCAALLLPLRGIPDVTTRCQSVTTTRGLWQNTGEGSRGQGSSAQSWEAVGPAGRKLLSPGILGVFGWEENALPDAGLAGLGWRPLLWGQMDLQWKEGRFIHKQTLHWIWSTE